MNNTNSKMPCIGILGVKIRLYSLPYYLRKIILSNTIYNSNLDKFVSCNLQVSPRFHRIRRNHEINTMLKIYTIKLLNQNPDFDIDIYIDSYKNLINDCIYIVYDSVNSDKYSYWDNYINSNQLDFLEWLKILKENDICYQDSGFFIVEQ